jgi:ubiquinone/menaquinone biosynthesis C-methylase UbiE
MQMSDANQITTGNRSEHVKDVFEDAQHYLRSRGVDVMFRTETVRRLAARLDWKRLLDIGCGDGSISLQLLTPESHMTLLDLSTSMVTLAKEKIPRTLTNNVVVHNENFMTALLDTAPFDLIITVGVLAHVDSPDTFLAKIRKNLRPGGNLIIEFTDSCHFVGRVGRFLGCLKEIVAPPKYQTNKICYADLVPLFEKNDLELVYKFRYSRIPLPGLDKIISNGLHYWLTRLIFNHCGNNTNASLGNEYICLLMAK